MKAEQVVEYGGPLAINEYDTPTPEGAQVVVRVSHCGVCHSDVHIHDGHFDLGGGNKLDVSAGRKLPFTLGHEIVGVVESTGPDVTGVKAGDEVAVYPWIGCGNCPVCDRGEEHLCNGGKALGVGTDGGFATHVLVPNERYCLDHSGIPAPLAGAYACSGLTAYSALKRLGSLADGDHVVIVGAGGVGMMGIEIAKSLFGRAPIVVDINDDALAAAKAAGCEHVFNSAKENAVAEIMAVTGGGAYAAVDFVGAEASFATASSCVRKGGRVVIVGLFGGAMAMPLPMFPMRAISIEGSFVGSPSEFKEVLELAASGKISPIPMEHRPLGSATGALEDLRKGGVIGRVVLDPQNG